MKPTPKQKAAKKSTIAALGRGAREAALAANPHGFAAVTKAHKSAKQYNRQKAKKQE